MAALSLSDRCTRIVFDLDFLAIEFLQHGQRGAAYRMLDMSASLCGECLHDDEQSPIEIAAQLTAVEGGAM